MGTKIVGSAIPPIMDDVPFPKAASAFRKRTLSLIVAPAIFGQPATKPQKQHEAEKVLGVHHAENQAFGRNFGSAKNGIEERELWFQMKDNLFTTGLAQQSLKNEVFVAGITNQCFDASMGTKKPTIAAGSLKDNRVLFLKTSGVARVQMASDGFVKSPPRIERITHKEAKETSPCAKENCGANVVHHMLQNTTKLLILKNVFPFWKFRGGPLFRKRWWGLDRTCRRRWLRGWNR